MASDVESILKLVNSYAEEMYIPNSFTVYLETTGRRFEDEDNRGRLDLDNSLIILNERAIKDEEDGGQLFDEYASSIIAYFQIPAYMAESAKNYEERKDDEIRVGLDEMKEIIKESLVLPGLCKYFELHAQRHMQGSHGYNFSGIEEDVMGLIVKEDDLGEFSKEDYDDMGIDRTSLYQLNQGFNIFEKLAEKAESVDYPRKDELLRACLIAASESGNFDAEFRKFIGDYTIEDIFVKARLESVPIPPALLDLETLLDEGFRIMGRVRMLRVSDIRPNVGMIHDAAKNAGLSVKEISGIGNIQEFLAGYSNQEEIVSKEHEDSIKEIYRQLDAKIGQFKNKRPKSISIR